MQSRTDGLGVTAAECRNPADVHRPVFWGKNYTSPETNSAFPFFSEKSTGSLISAG